MSERVIHQRVLNTHTCTDPISARVCTACRVAQEEEVRLTMDEHDERVICQYCGMGIDLDDPSFHTERYGHVPQPRKPRKPRWQQRDLSKDLTGKVGS